MRNQVEAVGGEQPSHSAPQLCPEEAQSRFLGRLLVLLSAGPRAQQWLEPLTEPRSLCLGWGSQRSRDLPPSGHSSRRLLCPSPFLPTSSLFSLSSHKPLFPLWSWQLFSPLLSKGLWCLRSSSSRCILLTGFPSEPFQGCWLPLA